MNGWFEGRYFPSSDGGIFVFFRNITTRKFAEDALRISEERLRLAQQAGHVGIWCFDLFEPERNYWSGETYAITGVDRSWRPSYSEWLALIHPEDRDQVDKTFSTAIESGRNDFLAAYRITGTDGRERWNEIRACVRRDAAGTALASSGVVSDISRRRAAEDALRESEIFNRSIVESSRDCIKVLSLPVTSMVCVCSCTVFVLVSVCSRVPTRRLRRQHGVGSELDVISPHLARFLARR